METLIEEIRALTAFTDQKQVQKLKGKIDVLNINDPETRKVLQEARLKGIY